MQYADIDKAPEERARGITINATHVEYETGKWLAVTVYGNDEVVSFVFSSNSSLFINSGGIHIFIITAVR